MKWNSRTMFCFLCVVLFASILQARPVTFVLNDQNGNAIAGSKFWGSSFGFISNGTTIDIADGSYSIALFPGINGYGGNALVRNEAVEVDETFDGTFEWITKTTTISVKDQNGVEIAGSKVWFYNEVSIYKVNGESITLPIADKAVYPTTYGTWQNGACISIYPGIQGVSGTTLVRNEVEKINDSFDGSFEWITKTVTISVTDQNGAEILGSKVGVFGQFPVFYRANGESVTLPVVDRDIYPTTFGEWTNGAWISVYPGILGVSGPTLVRSERPKINDSFDGSFEWITKTVTILVRDQNGAAIPGSKAWFHRLLRVAHC